MVCVGALVSIAASSALAQSAEELAMFKFLEAERAAKSGDHQRCADLLDDAQEHLGATNPKIDALRARCLNGAGRFEEAREALRRYFASKPDPTLLEYQELGRLAVELDAKLEQQRLEKEQAERTAAEAKERERLEQERLRVEREREEEQRRVEAEQQVQHDARERERRHAALLVERQQVIAGIARAESDQATSALWAVGAGAVLFASFGALAAGLVLVLPELDSGDGSDDDTGGDPMLTLGAGLALIVGGGLGAILSAVGLQGRWDEADTHGQTADSLRARSDAITLELRRLEQERAAAGVH